MDFIELFFGLIGRWFLGGDTRGLGVTTRSLGVRVADGYEIDPDG